MKYIFNYQYSFIINNKTQPETETANIGIEALNSQEATVKFWEIMDGFKHSKVNKIIKIETL